MLTIIKQRPEQRGDIRVFDVIQVDGQGRRTKHTHMARCAADISRTLGLQAGGRKVSA